MIRILLGKLMLNISPCHSEERSDEESLQGRANLYLHWLN